MLKLRTIRKTLVLVAACLLLGFAWRWMWVPIPPGLPGYPGKWVPILMPAPSTTNQVSKAEVALIKFTLANVTAIRIIGQISGGSEK